MEGNKIFVVDNGGSKNSNKDNGISGSEGLPPNPLAGVYRQYLSSGHPLGAAASCKKSLVRHPSLVPTMTLDVSIEGLSINDCETEFVPILRSGAWADIGARSAMEDVFVCADNFTHEYGWKNSNDRPSAFYGVFDGHGGKHAADFACYHLPRFIAEDEDFPGEIERAISSAFLQTDTAFAEACSLDDDLASGTTALAALVIGRIVKIWSINDDNEMDFRRALIGKFEENATEVCLIEKGAEGCAEEERGGGENGKDFKLLEERENQSMVIYEEPVPLSQLAPCKIVEISSDWVIRMTNEVAKMVGVDFEGFENDWGALLTKNEAGRNSKISKSKCKGSRELRNLTSTIQYKRKGSRGSKYEERLGCLNRL